MQGKQNILSRSTFSSTSVALRGVDSISPTPPSPPLSDFRAGIWIPPGRNGRPCSQKAQLDCHSLSQSARGIGTTQGRQGVWQTLRSVTFFHRLGNILALSLQKVKGHERGERVDETPGYDMISVPMRFLLNQFFTY